jgi:cell division protein ZapE
MDLYFECLPTQHKRRYHFHRFMHRVHHELKALRYEQDPLQIVAQRLASEAQVLCFDELFVSDIADAMILGGLFEYLFQNSVCLVATSNVLPGDLYREGLQRQRFLPAIALLERYTEVVNVDSGTDYRLRVLEKAEIYHHPLDQAAEDNLKESFRRLAPEPGIVGHVLEICGRPMRSTCCADDVVWFDFRELCDSPRSQNDYIELAQTYHAVLVSGVRQFNEETNDQARRFISLVDEFYDRGVKLILSAAVSVEALYRGKRLAFEFERTKSRLQEMQTHDYLARPHRP